MICRCTCILALIISGVALNEHAIAQTMHGERVRTLVGPAWLTKPVGRVAVKSDREIARARFYIDGRARRVVTTRKWQRARVVFISKRHLKPGRHWLKVISVARNGRRSWGRAVIAVSPRAGLAPDKENRDDQGVSGLGSGRDRDEAESKGVLFKGSRIADFSSVQAAPGAVTEVPDPLGSGQIVFRMTVDDDDVAPITPTSEPRAQMLTPAIIEPGMEFWVQTKILFPDDFPRLDHWPSGHWMHFLQLHGPPWDGSPPVSVGVDAGEGLRWRRNSSYDWDVPARAPLERGRWIDIVIHERFAREGWVEMWVDGRKQIYFGDDSHNPTDLFPTSKLGMMTRDHSNDEGANSVYLQSYRGRGYEQSVTTYHWPLVVGETRASISL